MPRKAVLVYVPIVDWRLMPFQGMGDREVTYQATNDRGQGIDLLDAVFGMPILFQCFEPECHPALQVDGAGQFKCPDSVS